VKRPGISGSPCATLFITVLHSDVNPKALIIQRVIKEHAVPADRKSRKSRFPTHLRKGTAGNIGTPRFNRIFKFLLLLLNSATGRNRLEISTAKVISAHAPYSTTVLASSFASLLKFLSVLGGSPYRSWILRQACPLESLFANPHHSQVCEGAVRNCT